MKGVNPEWAKLPKRKCDYCGLLYKPKQPLREGMLGFCCSNHRKEFHKHGGAYAKIRMQMEKSVRKELPTIHKRETEALRAEVTELRQLWSETEDRLVNLLSRVEAIERMSRIPRVSNPSRPSSPSPRV